MFLTEKKLMQRIEFLRKYRYRERKQIDSFFVKEDTSGQVSAPLPRDWLGWNKLSVGDTWKGWDSYLWVAQSVSFAPEWKDKQVVGVFDFGKTGGGNNFGFESLLYINESPYQGVDSNHKEVLFTKEHLQKQQNLLFRLWSGLEGGGLPQVQEHRFNSAFVAWLDAETDGLYYLADMALQTVELLDENNPLKSKLLNAVDISLRNITWAQPETELFYVSVAEGYKKLQKELEILKTSSDVTVWLTGHTHIDVAWLWRLHNTREKCARSFSTVLRLMEKYPEYIFLQTQPQLYAYIKEDFPQIYKEICQRVKENRWEADGAMWVEADCNLTSGESLTRQILLGSQFFEKEFGVQPQYLWLPDVFGYAWALPQILKKCDIDMFMTTKISWNQYNRMPHDTFWWQGIDGSRVLTHFVTTPEDYVAHTNWRYTYNGMVSPKTVQGVWDTYRNKDFNQDLLISYGYGDGGGGVNRDMLERQRCLKKMPGMPNVKTEKASDYFKKLKENVNNADTYVHVWDGELYLEYHRGTYTSQAYNKKMNRKMELLYRRAEWFAVLEALLTSNLKNAQQELLTQGWQQLLTHQFHDILPGSSIHGVYEDSRKNYEAIEAIGKQVEQCYLKNASDEKNVFTVFNTGSWKRSELVKLPYSGGSYCNKKGEVLQAQNTYDGAWVLTNDIPPMGTQVIEWSEIELNNIKSEFIVSLPFIETPFYRVGFNDNGNINVLFDKTYNRNVIAKNMVANQLQVFEDIPIDFDAWDIELYYTQKMVAVENLISFHILENGPLRLVLQCEYQFLQSTISQNIIFYANQRRIDFETKVNWHQQHMLLKAAFPVSIHSHGAIYDVQYGNVQRPNHWNTSWDLARFESVAHRWVDFSEHGYGVSILNDCKYGHDVKENIMRITLIKSATNPDFAADQGEHIFTYALLPHSGNFVEGNVVPWAFALNEPLIVTQGAMLLPCAEDCFIRFSCNTVELDAVKKAENGQGIIVRFHEFAGGHTQCKITLGFKLESWQECNLREKPITPLCNADIEFYIEPYEIKTLHLKPKL